MRWADILKRAPITKSALFRRKEVGINRRQYFISDIPKNSFGRFEFFLGRRALDGFSITQVEQLQ